MKISMIGCWYKNDIYSHHLNNIIEAIKKEDGISVKLITSNCNCFSSAQRYSITKEELLSTRCKTIKIPYAPVEPNKKYGTFKSYLVKALKLNYFLESLRGISFYWNSRNCDIVHFDQVLRSFGVLSFLVLLFLSKLSNKKVVVTIHELDPLQEKYKFLNHFYNWTDKIIVFSREFRDQLVNLKIKKKNIAIIPFCVSLEPVNGFHKDRFIYFGGHKLMNGKGFNTLLEALKILESKGTSAKVIIYVGHGCIGLEEGKKKVSDMGLDKYVIWSEFLSGSKLAELYQKSISCLIPYTGGSGRHPVTAAMANATPVIATKKAGLPEYLGESGIYINEISNQELAEAMKFLIDNPEVVKALGNKLRKYASENYGKEAIGKEMLKIYKQITGLMPLRVEELTPESLVSDLHK